MSLNESIVEDAALEWFGELVPQSREVGHLPAPRAAPRQAGGPHLAPGEPAAEPACASHADRRDSFGEVVLVGRLREALLRLNPAIPPSRTLATLRDPAPAGLPKLLSGELSVADSTADTGNYSALSNSSNRTKTKP